MPYRENPKTKGSGILAAIPQEGVCPNGCADCFFQSGRSYLEPLSENLPNMPPVADTEFRVVRVNDGNDSNVRRQEVMGKTAQYRMKFYNTAIREHIDEFDAPVVLTLNPGKNTDFMYHVINPTPKNLMMVRFRTNTWNLELCDMAVKHWTEREIPVILTFMAYHNISDIPEEHRHNYIERKRTLNTYWAITTAAWESVMAKYRYHQYVYSCGKWEGEVGSNGGCKRCGNCLREYFATMERLHTQKAE